MKEAYTLPEIVDAAIIRDPRPDDVLVLKVAANITAEQAQALRAAAQRAVSCKVVILSGDVELASFTGDVA